MPVNTSEAVGAKYLTFDLADEHYGLEILRVQEIVGLLPVTRIPRLPAFVAGVVNLRGRIVPVVDLRVAFGLDAAADGERTCIVVVRVERPGGRQAVMGVIVDEVSDVIALTEEQTQDTPEFGVEVDTSFIKGVGRIGDRVFLLLDIDEVLSGRELEMVERAARAAGDETRSGGDE